MNTTMTIIPQLDVLADLDSTLAAVTDKQIARAASKLGEVRKGEKTLGVIHNEHIKRLWVAMGLLKHEALVLAGKSAIADTDEDEKMIHESSHKTEQQADLLKTIFWMQIKSDISGWCVGAIGVREGWMVVSSDDETPQIPELIRRLFGQS